MKVFRLKKIREALEIKSVPALQFKLWEAGFDVKLDSLRRWERGAIPHTGAYLELKRILEFDDSEAFEETE